MSVTSAQLRAKAMKWHMTATSDPLYEAADIIDAQAAEIARLRGSLANITEVSASWVSVDDRLPDVGDNTVVIWSDGEASKMQGFGVTEAMAAFAVIRPTHWIPQPPTTEGTK